MEINWTFRVDSASWWEFDLIPGVTIANYHGWSVMFVWLWFSVWIRQQGGRNE